MESTRTENPIQGLESTASADDDQLPTSKTAETRASRVTAPGDDFAARMLAELPEVGDISDNAITEADSGVQGSSGPSAVVPPAVIGPSLGRGSPIRSRVPRFTINPWLVTAIVSLVGFNIYYHFAYVLGPAFVPRSQSERGFQTMVYIDQDGQERKFAAFVPHVYDKEKFFGGLLTRYRRPPVLLFLGGVGGEGLDGFDEFKKWLGAHVWEMQRRFPFVVVAPQGDHKNRWIGEGTNFELAMGMLKAAEKAFDTDRRRVYLIGLSFGGDGVWEFSLKRPGRFAAIAPSDAFYRLRGIRLTNGDLAEQLSQQDMGIWCAFNAGDRNAVVAGNMDNEEFLSEANIPSRFTTYLATGHESHAKFYREPELYTWMLERQLKFEPLVE